LLWQQLKEDVNNSAFTLKIIGNGIIR